MTHDFTRGHLLPILIKFTIPLTLGNLLQLTYNAVDSIIVGRFVGSGALAAVGTSNPLMTLIILFLQGISLGAGILIGTMFGAKEYDRLKRQVSTGMCAGLLFSGTVTAFVILFAPQILRLIRVDSTILGEAVSYLRIIALGLAFTFIYNYLASVLRAMGDSQSPLYFLAISALTNLAGDLIFVIYFHMGIHGCAIATALSEVLSAVLCWIYITRKIPLLALGRKWFVFDLSLLKLTIQYGLVSALQQATVQFGKICIQSGINSLGVSSAAAFSAGGRLDDYGIVVEQNMAHAMTSVMAQNNGAGKKDRVNEAFHYGMILEVIYGFLCGIVFYFFAGPLIRLFTADEEVIRIGVKFIRMMAFVYIFPGLTNGLQGYFRGIGDLKITLISSMINIGVKTVVSFILIFRFGFDIAAYPWACVAGWIGMLAFEVPFWISWKKRHGF